MNGTPKLVQISASEDFTVALAADGTAWAWGANDAGQLGDGTNNPSDVPVAVTMPPGVKFTDVAAGSGGCCRGHVIALDSTGKLWGWGADDFNDNGTGTATNVPRPVTAAPATNTYQSVGAGGDIGYAVASDGTGYAWGDNGQGEANVPRGVNFTMISGGWDDAVGLDTSGNAWGWGADYGGQLGTGGNGAGPVVMPPGVHFKAISVSHRGDGAGFALALSTTGKIYGWGYNSDGELGDGSTDWNSTPIAAATPAGVTFSAISAGAYHSLALDTSGRVWSWGANGNGQLGDGSTNGQLTPELASQPAGAELARRNRVRWYFGGLLSLGRQHRGRVATAPPQPAISRPRPSYGPASGGTNVTITGSGFTGATGVSFGNTPAVNYSVDSDGQITAVAPQGTGIVSVTVTGPGGSSPNTASSKFTYLSPLQPENPPWKLVYGSNSDSPVISNPQIAIVLVGSWWCALPGACTGASPGANENEALRLLDDLQSLVGDDSSPTSDYATVLGGYWGLNGCVAGSALGCTTTYVGDISLLSHYAGSPYGVAVVPNDGARIPLTEDTLGKIAGGFGNPDSRRTIYVLAYAPTGVACGNTSNSAVGKYMTALISLCQVPIPGVGLDDSVSFKASHEIDEAITSAFDANGTWSTPVPGGLDQIADRCEGRDPSGHTNDADLNPAYDIANLTRDSLGNAVASVLSPVHQGVEEAIGFPIFHWRATFDAQCTVGPTPYSPIGAAHDLATAAAGGRGPGLLQITTRDFPEAAVRRGYHARVQAVGGSGAYTFHLAAGQLPPGLSLNQASGTITGVPRSTGAWPLTIDVVDLSPAGAGAAPAATDSFTLLVGAPPGSAPSVSALSADHGLTSGGALLEVTGAGFSTAPAATSFTFGRAGTASDVHCPSTVSCTLVVPPGAPGTVSVGVTVAGRASSSAGAPTYTYVPLGALAANTSGLTAAQAGTGYLASVASLLFGGAPPYSFSLARGGMPGGLKLTRSGTITGVPSVIGVYPLTLRVSDSARPKHQAVVKLTLRIAPENARLLLLQVLAVLRAQLRGAHGASSHAAHAAAAGLASATAPNRWIDDFRLGRRRGQLVFSLSLGAIRALQAAPRSRRRAFSPLIRQIVTADAGLAELAVSQAASTRRQVKSVLAARRLLERGLARARSGQAGTAVQLFAQAWQRA